MAEEAQDQYDELDYRELQAEARACNLSGSGTAEDLRESLRSNDSSTGASSVEAVNTAPFGTAPDDDDVEDDDDDVQSPSEGSVDLGAVTGDAEVGHTTADGSPLTQANPEPADVAGASGAGGAGSAGADDPDNRIRAVVARETADAKYRAGDTPYTMPVVDPANNDDIETDEDGNPVDPEEAEYVAGGVREGGYTEANLPVEKRRQTELDSFQEAHPESSVIPPPLLPPVMNDPSVATPGLPEDNDL